MYAMKWSNRNGTYARPEDAGKWVAIDDASGGYPCVAYTHNQIEIWESLEEAKRYQKMFPHLDIYKLTIYAEMEK